MIDLQALGRQAEEIFFGKGSRVLFKLPSPLLILPFK